MQGNGKFAVSRDTACMIMSGKYMPKPFPPSALLSHITRLANARYKLEHASAGSISRTYS